MSGAISPDALRALVAGWIEAGRNVIGAARVGPERFAIRPLRASSELYLEGWAPTVNSIKEAVFPRRENLYSYRLGKDGIELIDEPGQAAEMIVIGAHPCQAAALPILDKVFNWDFADELYNRRRAATTVVSLACSSFDDQCFCTSVGLGPASEKGSDAMLYPAENGAFAVRVLTPKGQALFGEQVGQNASGGLWAWPAFGRRPTRASACRPGGLPHLARLSVSMPREPVSSRATSSRRRSGTSARWPAWVAASALTCARPATASTSWMRSGAPRESAHATGTPASSPCLRCTPAGTVLGNRFTPEGIP